MTPYSTDAQAVGRALRQSYRQGKVSWVIIPVCLPTPEVGDDTATADPSEVHDAGEAVKAEADAEMEASPFRTIWRVLRALAAHEARVVGRITELRASRSQDTAHTTAAKPTEGEGEAAEAGEGEQQPAPVESPIEWLRINARHHAARILQAVKLRAFNPRAVEWQRMHAVAAVFHLQHGHLDPTDKTKHAELTCRPQDGDQQAAGGLDGDRDRGFLGVAVLGEQVPQLSGVGEALAAVVVAGRPLRRVRPARCRAARRLSAYESTCTTWHERARPAVRGPDRGRRRLR
ncbi:hypothetical protein [Kitasatospora aureofaciens]|uniref:hypothetical protein n=1 Tax=Kitasatospora aureofaciens TaxID=1894 RepID=UPI000525368A|nr:hypothetical protein [Kitasatospora aureofaciens]